MFEDKNYRVEKVKNIEILPLLNLEPIYNSHSIYVCHNKPQDSSLAVISNSTNKIEAALITGLPELYLAQDYYLSASCIESAEMILNEIKTMKDFAINYPLWAENIMKKYFNNANLSYDNIYVYQKKDLPCFPKGKPAAQKLTCELFNSIEIPKELYGLLSSEDLIPESKFYSVVENNTLCAIGERLLDTRNVSAISQLITVKECRKKGYATEIITGLTREILKENKIPVYMLSEENIASKKSCEKVGFVLYSRMGYGEIE